MQVPKKYATVRAAIPFDEVSFGCGGLRIYRADELQQGQVGYSLAADGSSFCKGKPGDWKPEWIVIGHETGLGDPIIMDTTCPELPILTDMHGKGEWSPRVVASSLDAFFACMREFQLIAQGRRTPVERDAHPLSTAERKQFLEQIDSLNGGDGGLDFWEGLLEY